MNMGARKTIQWMTYSGSKRKATGFFNFKFHHIMMQKDNFR